MAYGSPVGAEGMQVAGGPWYVTSQGSSECGCAPPRDFAMTALSPYTAAAMTRKITAPRSFAATSLSLAHSFTGPIVGHNLAQVQPRTPGIRWPAHEAQGSRAVPKSVTGRCKIDVVS